MLDLQRIEGTSALFRIHPLQSSRVGGLGDLRADAFDVDDPCSPFGALGLFGNTDEDQRKARDKACKKVNEIEEVIEKRRRASRAEMQASVGVLELVAKPRADGATLFGVLATTTPDFKTLLTRVVDGFADGAPTADETKQKKALLAEVEAIDEEGRKALDAHMEGVLGRLGSDGSAIGMGGLGDLSGMGGVGIGGLGGRGSVGGSGGSSVGIGSLGGVGTGRGGGALDSGTKPKPPPADGKTRKP